jgi:hypothetical protein
VNYAEVCRVFLVLFLLFYFTFLVEFVLSNQLDFLYY